MTKCFVVGPESLFNETWPGEVMVGNVNFGFARDVMADLKGTDTVFVFVGKEAFEVYESLPEAKGNEYFICVDEFEDWVCEWVNVSLEDQGKEPIEWYDA